ncbi:MAG: gluconokinase [Pseudomonadota bacterium]
MGVSGCGKSSVGASLASRFPVRFIDGDDLHPPRSIEKMASGQPLDDDDRAPWLTEIGKTLARADRPVLIGCSSLKRKYRDSIREHAGVDVRFIHLHADKSVLAERVNEREGHFMPPSLLDSQFAALEMLNEDELGCVVDISMPYAQVVAESESYLKETMT